MTQEVLKALVVDDERLARARMKKLLSAHRQLKVVGEASDIIEAEGAIEAYAPDVVFLDIQMPGGSGFDLLLKRRIDAHVVFVTAFDQHAIEAFNVGAVDYLLKPVDPARLTLCVERLVGKSEPVDDRVALREGNELRLVRINDIALISAEGDYCVVRTIDGTSVRHKRSLAEWERRLGEAFFRSHRSILVALQHLERLERAEGSTSQVRLRGVPDAVPVSRARVQHLREILERTELS